MSQIDGELDTVTVLGERLRRALYFHVLARGEVGRDEAAAEVGISRSLAAFHLDKLVDAGLLEARYRRLSGRQGPGAGRPAKLYRRSERDLAVSVPPRNYELVARLLLRAAEEREGGRGRARDARAREAQAYGLALGRTARERAGDKRGRRALVDALIEVLGEEGFAPSREDGTIRLGNCPFDALARDYTNQVCGMNLEVMRGVARGLQAGWLRTALDPRPGTCCVAFSPTTGRKGSPHL
jgi:predicted ArsR family transcriptional regulator